MKNSNAKSAETLKNSNVDWMNMTGEELLKDLENTRKYMLNTLNEGKVLKLKSGGQKVAELQKEGDNIKVEYYTFYFSPKGSRSKGEIKYFKASTDKEILDVCSEAQGEINNWW